MNEKQIIQDVFENIRVDNPCPMILARMKGEMDLAYYCNSCNKEVIDFRNCSNEEIYKRASKGNVCGIFYENQLKGQHTVRYNLFQKLMFYFLIICSFLGFNVSPLNAQVKDKVSRSEFQYKKDTTQENNSAKTSKLSLKEEKTKEPPKSEKEVKKKIRRRYKRKKIMGCPAW